MPAEWIGIASVVGSQLSSIGGALVPTQRVAKGIREGLASIASTTRSLRGRDRLKRWQARGPCSFIAGNPSRRYYFRG